MNINGESQLIIIVRLGFLIIFVGSSLVSIWEGSNKVYTWMCFSIFCLDWAKIAKDPSPLLGEKERVLFSFMRKNQGEKSFVLPYAQEFKVACSVLSPSFSMLKFRARFVSLILSFPLLTLVLQTTATGGECGSQSKGRVP